MSKKQLEKCVLNLNIMKRLSSKNEIICNSSLKTIINEINKCACLCANCHRKAHAGRLNAPLVKLDITQVYET